MTLKVQPASDYWTTDVRLLSHWLRKPFFLKWHLYRKETYKETLTLKQFHYLNYNSVFTLNFFWFLHYIEPQTEVQTPSYFPHFPSSRMTETGCRNCDSRARLSALYPIKHGGYWNLAGMLHLTKYTRWYTFWCCYGDMLGSSLLPLEN